MWLVAAKMDTADTGVPLITESSKDSTGLEF